MNTCKVCGSSAITTHSKPEQIKYKDSFITVSLTYSTCQGCEREFVSTKQIKDGDVLIRNAKKAYDGLYTCEEIKAARETLGLSQAEAAELFGGGRNAFSKYERGEVSQSVSMDRLIKLCIYNQDAFYDLKNIVYKTVSIQERSSSKYSFSSIISYITESKADTNINYSKTNEFNFSGVAF